MPGAANGRATCARPCRDDAVRRAGCMLQLHRRLLSGDPERMCHAARRLYNAAIKDRAFTYAWFFLMFAAHIIFCIWSAVSPPLPLGNAWSHTGFILGVQARARAACQWLGVGLGSMSGLGMRDTGHRLRPGRAGARAPPALQSLLPLPA